MLILYLDLEYKSTARYKNFINVHVATCVRDVHMYVPVLLFMDCGLTILD